MKLTKIISALKARQNLGQVMNEVALRGDDYVIERAGRPLVAMIPFEKFQQLQRERGRFFDFFDQAQQKVKGENPRVMQALVNEALEASRKSKTKSKPC